MPLNLVRPKLQELGINGLLIKDYGGPGFTNLEAGAIVFEIAKRDACIGSWIIGHNAIGTAIVS